MKLSLILVVIFIPLHGLVAQDSTYQKSSWDWRIQSTDILVGVSWQGNAREEKMRRYYEIGVARGRYISHRHGITGGAIYVSEEMHFARDKNIFGTKVGAWLHWMLDFGIAAIYYTDFDRGNFKIRPEAGVGMGRLRAVVGYNIATINNRAFKELQKNNMQISIQLTAGIRKKKLNQ
jgi:hypothetical protein